MGQVIHCQCRHCSPEEDGVDVETSACCRSSTRKRTCGEDDGLAKVADDTHVSESPPRRAKQESVKEAVKACQVDMPAIPIPLPKEDTVCTSCEVTMEAETIGVGYEEGPMDRTDPNYRRIILEGGSSYEGQVHSGNGFYHGTGLMVTTSHRVFGEWQNGKLHGHGCQKWPDGRVYVGQFSEGSFSGRGRMMWPHARGVMVYEGEYLDDVKHGEGKFTWPSGKVFTGQWVRGQRHGLGVDTSASGSSISGSWEENVFSHFVPFEELPASLRLEYARSNGREMTPRTVASESSQTQPS